MAYVDMVGAMTSVVITSFVSLWRTSPIPNWAQSGNFVLLLCHVFVGYLSQLNLRTPCLIRQVNKVSAKHFYFPFQHTLYF
jgi:hypothetical protein